jgi:hypothetical protein
MSEDNNKINGEPDQHSYTLEKYPGFGCYGQAASGYLHVFLAYTLPMLD